MWRNKLPSIFRNIAVLSLGTLVAQLIQLGASPLLRRLFNPLDYGHYSLILSLSAILMSISMLRYELAIMLPKYLGHSIRLLRLAIFCSSIYTSILLLIIFCWLVYFEGIESESYIGVYVLALPLIVYGNSIYRTYFNLNSKLKNYKVMSVTQITRAAGFVLIAVISGLLYNDSPLPLVFSAVCGTFMGCWPLWSSYKKTSTFIKNSQSKTWVLAKKYKKFPIYSSPAALANTLAGNAMSLIIPFLFGIEALGHVSLAILVCGAPSIFLGSAISQVYYQSIVKTKNGSGNCFTLFSKTVLGVTVLSSIIYGLIYIFIDPFIHMAYGESWNVAILYSKILIPYYAVRFVSSTVGNTTSAFQKQEFTLLVNMILVLVSALIGLCSWAWSYSISQYLFFHATGLMCCYVVFIFIYGSIIISARIKSI